MNESCVQSETAMASTDASLEVRYPCSVSNLNRPCSGRSYNRQYEAKEHETWFHVGKK